MKSLKILALALTATSLFGSYAFADGLKCFVSTNGVSNDPAPTLVLPGADPVTLIVDNNKKLKYTAQIIAGMLKVQIQSTDAAAGLYDTSFISWAKGPFSYSQHQTDNSVDLICNPAQ